MDPLVADRIQFLLEADDDTFDAAVGADMRDNADPATAAALRTPQLFKRWLHSLQISLASLQNQMEVKACGHRLALASIALQHGSDQQRQAEIAKYESWRVRRLTVLGAMSKRLHECLYINNHMDTPGLMAHLVRERTLVQQQLDALRAAVEHHRDITLSDWEPTPQDQELWETAQLSPPVQVG